MSEERGEKLPKMQLEIWCLPRADGRVTCFEKEEGKK